MFVFQRHDPAVKSVRTGPPAPGTNVNGDKRSKRPRHPGRRGLCEKHHRRLVTPGESGKTRERRRGDGRRRTEICDDETKAPGPKQQIGRRERRDHAGNPHHRQRREINPVVVDVRRIEHRNSGRMRGNPRRRFPNLLCLEDYGKRERERGGVAGTVELHKPACHLLKTPAVLARKRFTGDIEPSIVNRFGQRDDHRGIPLGCGDPENSERMFVMSTERTVVSGKGKSNWSRLTDEELDQVNGDADTLISMIQEKYQEPRTSIEMQLEQLLAA